MIGDELGALVPKNVALEKFEAFFRRFERENSGNI